MEQLSKLPNYYFQIATIHVYTFIMDTQLATPEAELIPPKTEKKKTTISKPNLENANLLKTPQNQKEELKFSTSNTLPRKSDLPDMPERTPDEVYIVDGKRYTNPNEARSAFFRSLTNPGLSTPETDKFTRKIETKLATVPAQQNPENLVKLAEEIVPPEEKLEILQRILRERGITTQPESKPNLLGRIKNAIQERVDHYLKHKPNVERIAHEQEHNAIKMEEHLHELLMQYYKANTESGKAAESNNHFKILLKLLYPTGIAEAIAGEITGIGRDSAVATILNRAIERMNGLKEAMNRHPSSRDALGFILAGSTPVLGGLTTLQDDREAIRKLADPTESIRAKVVQLGLAFLSDGATALNEALTIGGIGLVTTGLTAWLFNPNYIGPSIQRIEDIRHLLGIRTLRLLIQDGHLPEDFRSKIILQIRDTLSSHESELENVSNTVDVDNKENLVLSAQQIFATELLNLYKTTNFIAGPR